MFLSYTILKMYFYNFSKMLHTLLKTILSEARWADFIDTYDSLRKICLHVGNLCQSSHAEKFIIYKGATIKYIHPNLSKCTICDHTLF